MVSDKQMQVQNCSITSKAQAITQPPKSSTYRSPLPIPSTSLTDPTSLKELQQPDGQMTIDGEVRRETTTHSVQGHPTKYRGTFDFSSLHGKRRDGINNPTIWRPRSGLEHYGGNALSSLQLQPKPAPPPPFRIQKQRKPFEPRMTAYEQYRPLLPPLSGCILPGPARSHLPIQLSSISAKTASGSPAWWCKCNKLVVVDGTYTTPSGTTVALLRTSRGLGVSRRKCEKDTVTIELPCEHCREMFGRRRALRFETRLRQAGVCKNCRAKAMEFLHARKEREPEEPIKS